MLNKKLRFIVDFLKESIKNTIFENHTYIVGGCLRDNFNGIDSFNDIDIVIDLPNDAYIDFCKYMCQKYNIRNLYNPFIEKTKHTSVFSLFNIKELSDIRFDVKMSKKNNNYDYGTLEENYNCNIDFTINALYYDISNDKLINFNENSLNDINNKLLRFNNKDIFIQSPIRIFRIIRFISYGYNIEKNTYELLKNNICLIPNISKDYMEYEVNKLNNLSNNIKSIELMGKLNIDYKQLGIIKKGEIN